MPKGLHTQGLILLTDSETALSDIESCLKSYEITNKSMDVSEWAFSGESITIGSKFDSRELIVIDHVSQKWPDHMGSPKEEPMILGAWTMGNFGPFAYPGSLERSVQQSWTWSDAASAIDRHMGFIRIRTTFCGTAGPNDPVIPDNYDALAELQEVTAVAQLLLPLENVICYFNPNGEVLREGNSINESLQFSAEHKIPPLELWSNVRLFNIDEQWVLMDTVGNEQFEIQDQEVGFQTSQISPQDADNFLRNITLYLLQNGDVINSGDTMDGPGGIPWQVEMFENSICDPPRRTMRWVPKDGQQLHEVLLSDHMDKQ